MKFEVLITGINSAIPQAGRHPSSQIVNYNDRLCLIDCGEGTQLQLAKYKVKKNKISDIFISHLHGDHCYGLPGLLTTMSLQNRQHKLNIHGPIGVKTFLDGVFEASRAHLSYECDIFEYDHMIPNSIDIHQHLRVQTFPLDHRIPTMGYRFQEINAYQNIDPEKITKYNLTIEEINLAKALKPINRNGELIMPDDVLFPPNKLRAYAYCSDTAYDERIVPYISDADLLYHETTYLDELKHLAAERKHSTLEEAARIARLASVGGLISGHYSSRYTDLTEFENRGKVYFDNFMLGIEGKSYCVSAK